MAALTEHVGYQLFDYMVVNSNMNGVIPPHLEVGPVPLNGDLSKAEAMGVKVVLADVVDGENGLRHDPTKLAASLMRIYYDKSQATARPNEVGQLGA